MKCHHDSILISILSSQVSVRALKVVGEKSTRINEILCKPCLDSCEIEYDKIEDNINTTLEKED